MARLDDGYGQEAILVLDPMALARKESEADLEAAGQTSLFGGGTQQVSVKQHTRASKTGKVSTVTQHQAQRKKAGAKSTPWAPPKGDDAEARLRAESKPAKQPTTAEIVALIDKEESMSNAAVALGKVSPELRALRKQLEVLPREATDAAYAVMLKESEAKEAEKLRIYRENKAKASPYAAQDAARSALVKQYQEAWRAIEGTWAQSMVDHLPKPDSATLALDYSTKELEDILDQVWTAKDAARQVGGGDFEAHFAAKLKRIGRGKHEFVEPRRNVNSAYKFAKDHQQTTLLDATDTEVGAMQLAKMHSTHTGERYYVAQSEVRAYALGHDSHVWVVLGPGPEFGGKGSTDAGKAMLERARDASGDVILQRELARFAHHHLTGKTDQRAATKKAIAEAQQLMMQKAVVVVDRLLVVDPAHLARLVGRPMSKAVLDALPVTTWEDSGAVCEFRFPATTQRMGVLTLRKASWAMPFHVIVSSLDAARVYASQFVAELDLGRSPRRGVWRRDDAPAARYLHRA